MPKRFGPETYVEQKRAVMDQKHVLPKDKVNGNKDSIGPGESSISSAVAELHNQHPEKWDDLGPHH